MKYLFFILLLGNGLFWLWQSYVFTPPPQIRTVTSSGAAQLLLLAERNANSEHALALLDGQQDSAAEQARDPAPDGGAEEAPQQPESQAEPEAGPAAGSQSETQPEPWPVAPLTEPPQAVAHCYTIGPFRDPGEIANARRRLADLGITSGQRVRSEREFFGYSVYLPPRASREDARALTRELRDRGITDYYIMSDRALRNAISLGLFRERRHAERLHRKVTAMGFSPRLEPRYRERELRWLDYRDDDGHIDAELLREISPQGELQRLDRDC